MLRRKFIHDAGHRTRAVTENIKTEQCMIVLHGDRHGIIFLRVIDEVLHKRRTVEHQQTEVIVCRKAGERVGFLIIVFEDIHIALFIHIQLAKIPGNGRNRQGVLVFVGLFKAEFRIEINGCGVSEEKNTVGLLLPVSQNMVNQLAGGALSR